MSPPSPARRSAETMLWLLSHYYVKLDPAAYNVVQDLMLVEAFSGVGRVAAAFQEKGQRVWGTETCTCFNTIERNLGVI